MEKVASLFTESLKTFKHSNILQLKNNNHLGGGGGIKLAEGMV